jgi:regulator of RNase E activity RraA
MSEAQVARLRRLDSCAVSDARDRLGLADTVADGITDLTGAGPVAGTVVTVELGPPRPDPSTRHLCTAAVDAAGPDDVIVVAHQGRSDCAGWGGNLSRGARQRGVAGTIVDGAVRDVDESAAVRHPVYALAATPRTARGRTQEHAWGAQIRFAGIDVAPGDYVIADRSGVVFVPAAEIDAVLEVAEAIAATEAGIAAAIGAGAPLSEAMGGTYERMTTTTDGGGPR